MMYLIPFLCAAIKKPKQDALAKLGLSVTSGDHGLFVKGWIWFN